MEMLHSSADRRVLYVIVTLFGECLVISIPDGAVNNIKTSPLLHAHYNMRLSALFLFVN